MAPPVMINEMVLQDCGALTAEQCNQECPEEQTHNGQNREVRHVNH